VGAASCNKFLDVRGVFACVYRCVYRTKRGGRLGSRQFLGG
jgi:hypothetical protein